MKILCPPFDLQNAEGFTEENDLFGRKSVADGLSKIIAASTDPLVIAINGPWGSGKTSFLKMWAGDLKKAGYPVVYFDAFENDYVEDAFAAVAGQLVSLVEERRKPTTAFTRGFVEKAVGAGKIIARGTLKVAVHATTAGLLKAEDIETAAKEIASEVSSLSDAHLGSLITKQKEQRKTIDAFKEALTELPSLLAGEGINSDKTKPLIFIIDELDRCKPLFALEILERVKHFFSVKNVHFVFGVHMKQLRNSLEAAYGGKLNSEAYLQKFINFTFSLPEPIEPVNSSVAAKYVRYLVEKQELMSDNPAIVRGLTTMFERIAAKRRLSLRSIERITSNLALTLTYNQVNNGGFAYVILGLCIIKAVDSDAYEAARRGELTTDQLHQTLGFRGSLVGDEVKHYNAMEVIWLLLVGTSHSGDVKAKVMEHFDEHFDNSNQVIPGIANDIVERFGS